MTDPIEKNAATSAAAPIAAAERAIVCLACEDYWYHPKRSRRHFMERLAARGWRVLFVNSIGMQAPKVGERDFWRRVRRKLRSWARWLRRPEPQRLPSFWVASPISLPLFGFGWIRAFNRLTLPIQLRWMMRRAGIRRPILWIGNPAMGELKGRLGERLSLMHNSDKYGAYGKLEDNFIAREADRLAAECDGVISASARLADECRELNPLSYHVAHGIDGPHFSAARAASAEPAVPADLAAIPRPRIGFVGTVDHIVSIELVEAVAQARPDWHQVFVGPPTPEFEDLRARFPESIHLLGQCAYAQVPAYLRGFDVATMPLVLDEWAKYCNHLKLREYLLAGRPIVTVPFEEADPFEAIPLLEQAGPEPADYIAALERGIAKADAWLDPATGGLRADAPDREALERQLAEIAQGSWEARTDDLERIFAEIEATRRGDM